MDLTVTTLIAQVEHILGRHLYIPHERKLATCVAREKFQVTHVRAAARSDGGHYHQLGQVTTQWI